MEKLNYKINIVYSAEKITPLLERLYRILSAGEFEKYYEEVNRDVHVYISNININLDIRFIHMEEFSCDDLEKEQFYILNFDRENGRTYKKLIQDIKLSNNVVILLERGKMEYGITEKITYEYRLTEDVIKNEKEVLTCSLHVMRMFYTHITKIEKKHPIFISYRGRDDQWRESVEGIAEKFRFDPFVDKYSIQNAIPEIFPQIEKSIGMIVLYHDTYGASYYTVEEITHAREHRIPIVIIQTGMMEISRVLQQTGNLKMFLSQRNDDIEISILKAMIHILYTSITKQFMERIIKEKAHTHYLPYQPTLYDISNKNVFKSDGDKGTVETVIYPEPIMFKTEREKFEKIVSYIENDKYKLKTIIQYQMKHTHSLNEKVVHFSVSNISNKDQPINRRIEYQMIDFLKLLIKYLLDNNKKIAYMGSLLNKYIPNYTKIIFNAAGEYNNQFLKSEKVLNEKDIVYVASHQIAEYEKSDEEAHFGVGVGWEELETKNDTEGRSVFAEQCDFLLAVGGKEKQSGNSGIILEILEYFKRGKPIFLLSDFGGASYAFSLFVRAVIEGAVSIETALQKHLSMYVSDYEAIQSQLNLIGKLSTVEEFYNNQLTAEELLRLEDCSLNYYEKIEIIIKGVNNVS